MKNIKTVLLSSIVFLLIGCSNVPTFYNDLSSHNGFSSEIQSFSLLSTPSPNQSKSSNTSKSFSSSNSVSSSSIFSSSSSYEDIEKAISIEGFTRNDTGFYAKIENSVDTFSFISKVSVPTDYTWSLYSDFEGKEEIRTKTIRCNEGSNLVYLLVYNDKETIGFYSINVYRLHMFRVTFNSNGGTYIEPQMVQEESCIQSIQAPEKTGYTFKSWDHDISSPILSNITFNAIWNNNRYKITFDVNGGDPLLNSQSFVTYDMNYQLPIPTYAEKEFLGWYLGEALIANSGKWTIAGDCELKASWREAVIYDEPTYIWSSDLLTCTATRRSVNYSDLEESEFVYTAYSIISSPSETVNGEAKFTATFTNPAFETQIKKITLLSSEAKQKLNFIKNDDNTYSVKASKNDLEGEIIIPALYSSRPVTTICEDGFFNQQKITSVIIGECVTTIETGAFKSCSAVETVTLSDSVTTIETGAFIHCTSLATISISKNVSLIAFDALSGCLSLTKISVDSENQFYSSFEGSLYNKDKTQIVCCPAGKSGVFSIPNTVLIVGRCAFSRCDKITSLILQSPLTTIESNAFRYCSSLESVQFPVTLESIGVAVFDHCQLLTDLTYDGTIQEWGNVVLATNWNYSLPVTVIHCSDGDIPL